MCGVMIVEDEALVLLELSMTVEELGYDLHSESTTIDRALEAADREDPDVALLDIDVGGEPVWPVARKLTAAGRPIIFVSANLRHPELDGEFSTCHKLEKPASRAEIESALRSCYPKEIAA